MIEEVAFKWTELFLAVSLLQKTIEMFLLRNEFSCEGPWSEKNLLKDLSRLPAWYRGLYRAVLPQKNYLLLLSLHGLLAVSMPFLSSGWINLFVAVTFFVLLQRWRGAFNGGSDAITFAALLGCSMARLSVEFGGSYKIGLFYIAVIAIMSYFLAGLVKAKEQRWWAGKALGLFLKSRYFNSHRFFRSGTLPRVLLIAASWGVILFELLFPLSVLAPPLAIFFCGLALLFHITNWWVFGLNRFVLSWLATYPSILLLAFSV